MNGPIHFTQAEVAVYYRVRVPDLKQNGHKEWRGPCPVHGGTRDSFAVNGEDGRACCHSACNRGWDIIGLEQELFGSDFKTAKAEVFAIVGRDAAAEQTGTRRIVATYDYKDESGTTLYQTVRFEPKDFRQRRPDGAGDWVWNLKGTRLVIYNLPNVLAAEMVNIVEGEKDADTLNSLGMVATCNSMGALKWRAEYAEFLRGKSVNIFPDIDSEANGFKGQQHAAAVAGSLIGVAASIRIIELPRGKDVSDFIAAGGTIEDLRGLIAAAPEIDAAALETWLARYTAKPKATEPKHTPEPGVAPQFSVSESGVYYTEDPEKDSIRVCSRLDVIAYTRDAQNDSWGRLLHWRDAEGNTHKWAMPMNLLAGDGNDYRARLLAGGLNIEPGRKAREALNRYLQTTRPEKWARCVARIGWYGDVFVLPAETIGASDNEIVIFQAQAEVDHAFNVGGTVDEWRGRVGRYCSGNSRLIVAVACSFAGPVLQLIGGESGGVHFVGGSSTGKTTALIVGGSVCGGGGRNGFVNSWRATANGLESVAEMHNDMTLFLDELAQVDAREAADVAYLLGNGAGKTRMSRTIGARRRLAWNLLYVSAGEITLADHAQTAGKRTKGGADVRLLNVQADAGAGMGLFENLHGFDSPDAFSRTLKEAAKMYYGAPLRTFLNFVTANRAAVETALRRFQADFLARHVPADAGGEVFRAASRFAMIAAAGELATEIGITGWKEGESIEAAAICYRNWLGQRGTTGASDVEDAIRQVRAFFERHGASRFQFILNNVTAVQNPDEHQIVRDRAGFRRRDADGETEYLILSEVFRREVCAGFDHKTVARALADRGFLEIEDDHHLTVRRTLPEIGKQRVYAIKAKIMGGEDPK